MRRRSGPNHDVALDRSGITVFRDITFLAAGPASERSRSATGGRTVGEVADMTSGSTGYAGCSAMSGRDSSPAATNCTRPVRRICPSIRGRH